MLTGHLGSPAVRALAPGAVICCLALATGRVTAAEPRHPFPQNVAYAVGSLTPGQRPLGELNAEVAAAYRRWKARYLAAAGSEPDGHPRYRVVMTGEDAGATVSEGQGYGMIVVALMAGEEAEAQRLFDGLWELAADHPSEADPRLMDWHVPPDESAEPGEDDSAFDGDCDIAYALLLAEEQWGSQGRVDYRARALEVLAGILDSTIGPDSRLPLLGDWVDPDGAEYNQYTTRTSDLMPSHFRAFARATSNPAWDEVTAASQQLVETLQIEHSPAAGLLPDFVVPMSSGDHSPEPAPPEFLEGPYDGAFYYNAGRDPWRLALDALVNGNAVSREQVRRMSRWFRAATGGDPGQVRAGYLLDGTPIGDYFTTFFAAPFGVAAMVDPEGQNWLDATFDLVVHAQEGYYEDSVALLSLLVMTRNWWDPSRPPSSPDIRRPSGRLGG